LPSKNRLLLFSSDSHADESFIGYLLRLTELNRFETLSWILQLAQIKSYVRSNLSFAFDSNLQLTMLSKLCGVDKRRLTALLYRSSTRPKRSIGDYLIFDSAVPQYMLRLLYPKICPACLNETGYIHRVWELAPVTTCPVHKCMLLDECPNCMKRISWARRGISSCRCEFDWREHQTPTVGVAELEVANRLYLLCNLPTCAVQRGNSENTSPLNNLNLKNFLSALFFVASQYAGVIDTKGKHLAPSMRNADLHVLLCKGWKVFENWPCSYFDFLSWRRTQVADSTSGRGLQRDFAEYKSALYKQLATPELDFMRTAFEEYLVTHWDGGYTAHVKRLNGMAHCDGKYVSRRKAKDLLRMGVQSIDKLIAIGKLKAIVKRQDRTRSILIERASLLDFKRELDQSLYLKQVQGLLGLSHKRVLELGTCGLLNPLRGPTVDECSDWRFSEKEVKDLLDKIKITIRSYVSAETGATVSFLMAFRKLRRAHISMGQFIQDIFSGEVYPCAVSSKLGLDAFQFSKRLIAEYVCRLTWNIKDGEIFCFPVKEALNGQARNLHAN
jgi:hypothetical protein